LFTAPHVNIAVFYWEIVQPITVLQYVISPADSIDLIMADFI